MFFSRLNLLWIQTRNHCLRESDQSKFWKKKLPATTMKIINSNSAPPPTAPASKAKNVSKPAGNEPKPKGSKKPAASSTAKKTRRPKKSVEELDAEMADYFDSGNA